MKHLDRRLRHLERCRSSKQSPPRPSSDQRAWLEMLIDADLEVLETCLRIDADGLDLSTVPTATWERHHELLNDYECFCGGAACTEEPPWSDWQRGH